MNRKLLIIVFFSIAIIFIIAGIYTAIKYHTINPIRALGGYVNITVFNKDYSTVQNIPNKTIFANESYYLQDYMKKQGFTEIEEKRMGTTRVFTNGDTEEHIDHWTRLDGFPFSIWVWER